MAINWLFGARFFEPSECSAVTAPNFDILEGKATTASTAMEKEIAAGGKHLTVSRENGQHNTVPSGQFHATPERGKPSKERPDFMRRSPSENVLLKYNPSPLMKSKQSHEISSEKCLTFSGANEQHNTIPLGQSHTIPKRSKSTKERPEFMHRSPSEGVLVKYIPSPPMKSKPSHETSREKHLTFLGANEQQVSDPSGQYRTTQNGGKLSEERPDFMQRSHRPRQECLMKYSPSPPMKAKRFHETSCSDGKMPRFSTHKGRKLVSHSSSAPLPRRSPSKASPSFTYPSPRKPNSAPSEMNSAFCWPLSGEKHVHVQSNRRGKSRLSTLEELNKRQEDGIGNLLKHSNGGGLLWRRKMKNDQWGPSEASHRNGETSFSGQTKDEGKHKVTNMGQNLSYQQSSDFKGEEGQNAPLTKPKLHHKREPDAQEQTGNNDVTPVSEDGKLNVAKYVAMRKSSPDSFVAQLIANSKTLTLYDSVESPTLQERKKRARALRKERGYRGESSISSKGSSHSA